MFTIEGDRGVDKVDECSTGGTEDDGDLVGDECID